MMSRWPYTLLLAYTGGLIPYCLLMPVALYRWPYTGGLIPVALYRWPYTLLLAYAGIITITLNNYRY